MRARVSVATWLAAAVTIAASILGWHASAQEPGDPLDALKPSLGLEPAQSIIPPADPDRGGGPPSDLLPPDPPEPAGGASPEAAVPPIVEPPRPLRFGVLARRDVVATMGAVGAVADDLSDLLGRAVEVLPMSSYRAMIDAQVQQRIDGGFYSSAAYALAEASCRCLEPIAAPASSDGTLAYHAVVLARHATGISSAADLEGKVIAAAAPDSLGGRRMQLAGLLAEGVDPSRFGGILDAGSSEEAVRSLLAGKVDAAFAWSTLSGDQELGYSRGTMADLVRRDEISMADVAVVWRSPAIPHGPMAVLKSLPQEDKQKLETYLLRLQREKPRAYDALSPFYGGGYDPVDPEDYRELELLLAQNVDALSIPDARGEAPSEAAETGKDR